MKLRTAVTILMVMCITALYAQDDYVVLLYDGPSHLIDQSKVVLLDAAGNIYVTGYSTSSANAEDYVTIKYNSLGQSQWVARYDGPGHSTDISNAMAIDAAGNVYVTGKSRQTTSANTEEYCTIKYNSAGVQQWVARYDSPYLCNGTYNEALAIAVDAAGNVYITGDTRNVTYLDDITTIKYNSAGTQQWLQRYNYSSNKEDIGKFLKLDASGNVFVGGISNRTNYGYDYVLIKYNNGGTQQWVKRYNGPGNGDDIMNGMAMDNLGNIYATGSSKGANNVNNFATVKFDNATGDTAMVLRYAVPGGGSAEGKAVVVDDYFSIYVTGAAVSPMTNYDYVTIKYDNTGAVQWMNRYDGPPNGIDKPVDIKLRRMLCGAGDNPCFKFSVYVTGQSAGLGTQNDYATVKYNEKGLFEWAKRYNGTGNSDDVPTSLAIKDANEFVYVTGTSHNDYATVWYVPNPSTNNNITGPEIPANYSLSQNYPNPFNPSTNITFGLPVESNVSVIIYDASGKKVAEPVSGMMDAGNHTVSWNAADMNSGVYFCKLIAGSYVETRKMVLIK